MSIEIKGLLKNCNLHVDGYGLAGRVLEFDPPSGNMKTEEYRAAGMPAPVEIEMGFEKQEAKFVLGGFIKETLKLYGLSTGQNKSLTMRGTLVDGDGTKHSIRVQMQGKIKVFNPGTFKPGEMAKFEHGVAIDECKWYHDEELIHHLAPAKAIWIVDGVDQMEQERKNLGL